MIKKDKCCPQKGHENYKYAFLCSNTNCKQDSRLLCNKCLESEHFSEDLKHIISFEQISNVQGMFELRKFINDKLKTFQEQLQQYQQKNKFIILAQQLNDLQQWFNEEIGKTQKNIQLQLENEINRKQTFINKSSELINILEDVKPLQNAVNCLLSGEGEQDENKINEFIKTFFYTNKVQQQEILEESLQIFQKEDFEKINQFFKINKDHLDFQLGYNFNLISQEKRFENYEAGMITVKNTSHKPSNHDYSMILNDQKKEVIGWDDKTSGWITFDFKKDYEMVKFKINSGDGKWKVEFSDDNLSFQQCAEIDLNTIKEVCWNQGSHRYWRLSLQGAHGKPWYYGYQWFNIQR